MKSKTERLFGEFVFSDKVMKKYLDPFSFHTYKKIKNISTCLKDCSQCSKCPLGDLYGK